MMESTLGQVLEMLPESHGLHARTTPTWKLLDKVCKEAVALDFKSPEPTTKQLGSFGDIQFPYVEMGAITSLELFGLDELIIFSFYQANKNRYKKTLDIGANIGLHSIMMSRCGFNVTCFEPDPKHIELLSRNLQLNDCTNVTVKQGAMSDQVGKAEFVRVEGNTTGSHLAGAKANPYGDLTKFEVDIFDIKDFLPETDFIKLDVEGHEVPILKAIDNDSWKSLDLMAEIGTPENAQQVWDHFEGAPVNLFSQKLGWNKVKTLDDVPTSYKEGSLFISAKEEMPW